MFQVPIAVDQIYSAYTQRTTIRDPIIQAIDQDPEIQQWLIELNGRTITADTPTDQIREIEGLLIQITNRRAIFMPQAEQQALNEYTAYLRATFPLAPDTSVSLMLDINPLLKNLCMYFALNRPNESLAANNRPPRGIIGLTTNSLGNPQPPVNLLPTNDSINHAPQILRTFLASYSYSDNDATQIINYVQSVVIPPMDNNARARLGMH